MSRSRTFEESRKDWEDVADILMRQRLLEKASAPSADDLEPIIIDRSRPSPEPARFVPISEPRAKVMVFRSVWRTAHAGFDGLVS